MGGGRVNLKLGRVGKFVAFECLTLASQRSTGVWLGCVRTLKLSVGDAIHSL